MYFGGKGRQIVVVTKRTVKPFDQDIENDQKLDKTWKEPIGYLFILQNMKPIIDMHCI